MQGGKSRCLSLLPGAMATGDPVAEALRAVTAGHGKAHRQHHAYPRKMGSRGLCRAPRGSRDGHTGGDCSSVLHGPSLWLQPRGHGGSSHWVLLSILHYFLPFFYPFLSPSDLNPFTHKSQRKSSKENHGTGIWEAGKDLKARTGAFLRAGLCISPRPNAHWHRSTDSRQTILPRDWINFP